MTEDRKSRVVRGFFGYVISEVSGVDDGADVAGAGADGFGAVSGAAGCEAAGCGTATGCFFCAFVTAALRAAAFRFRVRVAFEAAARRFAAFRLRVAAAFFPALFLGLISSSVAIPSMLGIRLPRPLRRCP